MRISSLLVGFLGLSLIGCVGVIEGGDPVGDDDGSGSGSGSNPDPDPLPIPRLDSTIDKTTVDTELGTTHTFSLSVVGSGDFAGAVTVTPTVVDSLGAAMPGWTVNVDLPTITLATNGTATVKGTLVIPTENMGLAGTVKFAVTSALGTESLDAAVTAANQVTLTTTTNSNDQCVYPSSGIANALKISVGSKVRFLNMSAAGNLTIHIDGGGTGFDHQNDPGSPTNTAYEQTAAAVGTINWYCHNTGPNLGDANPKIQVVAAQ